MVSSSVLRLYPSPYQGFAEANGAVCIGQGAVYIDPTVGPRYSHSKNGGFMGVHPWVEWLSRDANRPEGLWFLPAQAPHSSLQREAPGSAGEAGKV